MIPSPHHSGRGGARVRLVVLHTAEGARTVESLGKFFQGTTQASSHVGIDDKRIEQYVSYDRAAWTLRSGNPISDNAELCGFAKWSRAEWLQHPRMLDLAAQWIRERCRARGIPLRKLTPTQVAAGESGVIGHHDWTVGKKEGSHWDPGPNFPWDLVMAKASGGATAGTAGGGDDVSYDDAYRAIKDVLSEEFDNPSGNGRRTNLRSQISHGDWRADYQTAQIVGQLSGQIAGLAEAIRQIGQEEELDLAAIEAAAQRGAERGTTTALETGTVQVDITVAGGGQ